MDALKSLLASTFELPCKVRQGIADVDQFPLLGLDLLDQGILHLDLLVGDLLGALGNVVSIGWNPVYRLHGAYPAFFVLDLRRVIPAESPIVRRRGNADHVALLVQFLIGRALKGILSFLICIIGSSDMTFLIGVFRVQSSGSAAVVFPLFYVLAGNDLPLLVLERIGERVVAAPASLDLGQLTLFPGVGPLLRPVIVPGAIGVLKAFDLSLFAVLESHGLVLTRIVDAFESSVFVIFHLRRRGLAVLRDLDGLHHVDRFLSRRRGRIQRHHRRESDADDQRQCEAQHVHPFPVPFHTYLLFYVPGSAANAFLVSLQKSRSLDVLPLQALC